MKALFLTPRMEGWDMFGKHRAPNQLYAHWAAYAREKGYEDVQVLDCQALDISKDAMIEQIEAIQPDVVVLGQEVTVPAGFAPFWYFEDSARAIKETLPETKIVVGGLWYSGLPEETLEENPAIDYVVMSEEGAFCDLLGALSNGQDVTEVAGIAYRENGSIALGPSRQLHMDLDQLPLPAYDLFPMDKYVGHGHWQPFVELVTSRGCPVACTFCYGWSKHDPRTVKDYLKWRAKSATRVVEELEVLHHEYGVKVVLLQDDNFIVDPERTEEFCRLKIEKGNPIKWVALGRAVDWVKCEHILPLMVESGMFMGLFGIEVTTPEELKKIGKGITIPQIKQTVDILRQHDVAVVADIMIGFDYDTEEIIRQRFDFTEEVDPDIVWLGYATPAPNAPLWDSAIEKGLFSPKALDFRQADFVHPVMPTEHLTVEELERVGAECLGRFFNKPGRIQRIMSSNFDPLAKLCFQQAMEGVAEWASDMMVETGKSRGGAHLSAEGLLGMLHMGPGDLEPYVITPGQPERLSMLLEQMEDTKPAFEVFGFQAHRGTMAGKSTLVCNGGMDAPLAAIATEIFCVGGAQVILRAGSCGSLLPEVKVGDLVIATGVVRGDGLTHSYVPDNYPAIADLQITQALIDAAEKLGVPYHVGLVWTTDAMLRETEEVWKPIADLGVKAVDMVTSALFTISALNGARAGAVLAVSDNLATHEIGFMNPAYHQAEMQAIQICIEALGQL